MNERRELDTFTVRQTKHFIVIKNCVHILNPQCINRTITNHPLMGFGLLLNNKYKTTVATQHLQRISTFCLSHICYIPCLLLIVIVDLYFTSFGFGSSELRLQLFCDFACQCFAKYHCSCGCNKLTHYALENICNKCCLINLTFSFQIIQMSYPISTSFKIWQFSHLSNSSLSQGTDTNQYKEFRLLNSV